MIKNIKLLTTITIVFSLTLLGCSKKTNTGNDITQVTSNTEVVQASPVNTPPTNAENKVENTDLSSDEITDAKQEIAKSTPIQALEEGVKKEQIPNKATAADADKEKKEHNKKVIVIDPGHGGKSNTEKEPVSPGSTTMKTKNVSGATGVSTKTPEHVIALKVSLALKDKLEAAGHNVIMTRTTAAETISNVERAELGNKNNADLAIRIHADSAEDSSARGASMLVPGEAGYAKDISKISKKYGEIVFNTLLSEVGMKSRGIVTRTDLTGFNWSKVPVILIEMGFLSNPEEDKLLSSEDYQKKISAGLFKGIEKALEN